LLTILHRGSLKREIAKEIRNATTKKRGKSNSKIRSLSVRNVTPVELLIKNYLNIDI